MTENNEQGEGIEYLSQDDRPTFIIPFVVSTFLALPSLLVVAYSKQTASFDLMLLTGLYVVVIATLSILLVVSFVSALLYLWRGRSHTGKVGVVILEVVAVASFIYIIMPR